MERLTSYLIDGNLITAFILIPSFYKGYTNWFFHELVLWYSLLAIVLYLRSKVRQWRFS